jgi:hypothetical protein
VRYLEAEIEWRQKGATWTCHDWDHMFSGGIYIYKCTNIGMFYNNNYDFVCSDIDLHYVKHSFVMLSAVYA